MTTTIQRSRRGAVSTLEERSDTRPLGGWRRTGLALVISLFVALAGIGAWLVSGQTRDSDSSRPLAIDPEIEELIADYFAARNAYDPGAFRDLTTDDYIIFQTQGRFPSGGFAVEVTRDEALEHFGTTNPNVQPLLKRLGEPFMIGDADGPWHVAQAWESRLTTAVGTTIVHRAITIITVVDDDGILRVAREIATPYRMQSTD